MSGAGSSTIGVIRRPVRVGFGLVAICGLAIGLGVWALVPPREALQACLVAAVGLALAGLNAAVPGAGRAPVRLLVFPMLVVGEQIALGVIDPAVAQPYLPIASLGFIYVGLTCPPKAVGWLLAPGVAGWLVAYGVLDTGLRAAVLIRLPITIVVWILIAELLAWHASQVRRHTELLNDQAHTDALTGLPNRRALPQLLGSAQAGDALVMLDVDRFRQVNEQSGHAGGDAVLRLLGSVIRSVLRAPDEAVRYGGEEILLLLPGACTAEAVDGTLRRLRDAWTAAAGTLEQDAPVTFSGGAVILGDLETPGAAVRAADVQLYDAKQAGRNRWHIRPSGRTRSGARVVPPRDGRERIARA